MSNPNSTTLVPAVSSIAARWRRWGFGPHRQGPSDYWTARLAEDPALLGLRMTVELVLGGDVVVAIATVPMQTVSGTDGSVHAYLPLLTAEPEVDHAYTLGSPTSEAKSITIELSSELLDAVAIVAGGKMLAGFGEVALQCDGGDHDERIVLIRGDMAGGVTFGAQGETITCEIVDPRQTFDLQIPPWVATTKRWANLHETAAGYRYPIVLRRYNAIPALRVTNNATNTNTFVVAYGHAFTVSTVWVNGVSVAAGDVTYPWTASYTDADSLGTPVTSITVGTESTAWSDSDTVVVTLVAASGSSLPNDVLGIVRHLVEGYTQIGADGYDVDSHGRAVAKLGSMTARALINASGSDSTATTMAFIESGLLSSFPMISMAWDGGRYGPIVTNRRAAPVMDLVAGAWPLIDRASLISETPKEALFNQFTLRYGYDPILQSYASVIVVDAGNNETCRTSMDLVDLRSMAPIESVVIFDDSVAGTVVDWLVEHFALPSYYVEYNAAAPLFLQLKRGDNVRLTDDRLGLTNNTTATCERLAYSHGQIVVGLRVWLP